MPKEYPRKLRINAQLQRELTDLIRNELSDPRLAGGVTVLAVDVSPDMRHAKVLVSPFALGADAGAAVAALTHAAGKLRYELKLRLKVKHIPELHFRADATAASAEKLNRLIRDARSADEQHAARRGGGS